MDHATPNLPSRDFEAPSVFYSRLGFEEDWRDEGRMILKRGGRRAAEATSLVANSIKGRA
jgi:predicted lactoylglutathione lyase